MVISRRRLLPRRLSAPARRGPSLLVAINFWICPKRQTRRRPSWLTRRRPTTSRLNSSTTLITVNLPRKFPLLHIMGKNFRRICHRRRQRRPSSRSPRPLSPRHQRPSPAQTAPYRPNPYLHLHRHPKRPTTSRPIASMTRPPLPRRLKGLASWTTRVIRMKKRRTREELRMPRGRMRTTQQTTMRHLRSKEQDSPLRSYLADFHSALLVIVFVRNISCHSDDRFWIYSRPPTPPSSLSSFPFFRSHGLPNPRRQVSCT